METVAVIGRPNVGKSSLFNKLIGKRKAIVEDVAGVTRDRNYAVCEWAGVSFRLVDTGGIEPHTKGEMQEHIKTQVNVALDEASVILFLVDSQVGIQKEDMAIAKLLRGHKEKKILLVLNKADNMKVNVYEYRMLGIKDIFPVSSIHGSGTGDLLEEITRDMQKEDAETEEITKIALVGRPNSGKSSLLNKFSGENRQIVSDIAGTTRDSIDEKIKYFGKDYIIIDTAGIRKKARVEEKVEVYSVMRAKAAIEDADAAVLLIDATVGVTEQDSKIAGIAHEVGKPVLIAVNKWDAVAKDNSSQKEYIEKIRFELPFILYSPIIFISAMTGSRIGDVFKQVDIMVAESRKRLQTSVFNEFLGECILRVSPPQDKGKRLKIYYGTQTGICPPTFVLSVNDKNLMHFSYERYLENQLRQSFGFTGSPINILCKNRGGNHGR